MSDEIVVVENIQTKVTIENQVNDVLIDESTKKVVVVNDIVTVVDKDNSVNVVSVGIVGPRAPVEPGIENIKLEFVGKGTGSSKTTTVIIGEATLAEVFGIGDELYLQWILPTNIDVTIPPILEGHFFPSGNETDTTVSWQIDLHVDETDIPLDSVTTIIYIIDAPLPDTAYLVTAGELEFPNSGFLSADTEAVHIRIKRISSTDDPSAKVGIEHLAIRYTTDGKIGHTGEKGDPGDPYTNKIIPGIVYTILDSDSGSNLIFTNANSIAITLPDDLSVDHQCKIIQVGLGIPTVTPITDTINGAGVGVSPTAQWKELLLNQYAATTWLASY